MNYLKICGTREGYTTGQRDRTMTVGEFIDYQQNFDFNLPVYISHDNGHTYCSVSEEKVYQSYCREDPEDQQKIISP